MAAPRTDFMVSDNGLDKTTSADVNFLKELGVNMECEDVTRTSVSGDGKTGAAGKTTAEKDGRRRRSYEKELTVLLECVGKELGPMVLLRAASSVCGNVLAFRQINKQKYELTVSTLQAKGRLLDGFRVGETVVHGRDISTDELVVSFLGLPAYIVDEEIVAKLLSWGVSAVSEVRRRMWPGTDVADGTRFVRVRFTDTVQSLPYSVRFNTAAGPEYFRVIHDRQVRVCRGCLQPDHVLRDCPDFLCRNCGGQGHYARECTEPRAPKCRECRMFAHLCPCREEESTENVERLSAGGERGSVSQEGVPPALSESQPAASAALDSTTRSAEAPERGREKGALARPTLNQGEGVKQGPTPEAGAAAVEPGRRMDGETVPHLTSEAGEVTPGAGQTPKPGTTERGRRDTRLPQRTRSQSRKSKSSAGSADAGGARAPGELKGIVGSQTPVMTSIPFTPPSSAAFSLNLLDDDDDLMPFETTEQKKRQSESEGGKLRMKRIK